MKKESVKKYEEMEKSLDDFCNHLRINFEWDAKISKKNSKY